MFFLLFLLILFNNGTIAMENTVLSSKHNGKLVILQRPAGISTQDFYKNPALLIKNINQRVRQYNDYVQAYTKKKFYMHHGNLLIYAVNANQVELFEKLLQIPEIKSRRLYWKEFDVQTRQEKEASGTIRDYVAFCMQEIAQIPASISQCWQLVQNSSPHIENNGE